MGADWEDTSEGGGGSNSLGKIYRAAVQAVLLFGAETWVLMETMIQRLQGAHVSFLRKVTRKQSTRRRDLFWWKVRVEADLHGAGTQMLRTYMDKLLLEKFN